MRGIITTRHLVVNAPEIIESFGLGAYFRCLSAALFGSRPVTFLELVVRVRAL